MSPQFDPATPFPGAQAVAAQHQNQSGLVRMNGFGVRVHLTKFQSCMCLLMRRVYSASTRPKLAGRAASMTSSALTWSTAWCV